jgi:hypothetical protein
MGVSSGPLRPLCAAAAALQVATGMVHDPPDGYAGPGEPGRERAARLRLRVRLSGVALRRLAREGKLSLTLRIVTTPAGGGPAVTTSKSVRLKS